MLSPNKSFLTASSNIHQPSKWMLATPTNSPSSAMTPKIRRNSSQTSPNKRSSSIHSPSQAKEIQFLCSQDWSIPQLMTSSINWRTRKLSQHEYHISSNQSTTDHQCSSSSSRRIRSISTRSSTNARPLTCWRSNGSTSLSPKEEPLNSIDAKDGDMKARTAIVLIDATNVLATMHLTNALAQRTMLPRHQFVVTVVRITSQASKAAQNWQTFSNHAKHLLRNELQSRQDNSKHKSATLGNNDSKLIIKTIQSWTTPLTFRASSVITSRNRNSASLTPTDNQQLSIAEFNSNQV